jgi:4-hydroxybutyrate CoA-transferase
MALFSNASELLQKIQSHQRVFVQGAAATPNVLLQAVVEQHQRLKEVEIMHLHTEGPCHYALPKYKEIFRVVNLFVGSNMRSLLDYDRVDYLPCFLSEIPALFNSGRRPIDVALLNLSPPDRNGYCSLGTSVDVSKSAFENAKIVLAQINTQMPRVHGDGFIQINDLDGYIEVDEPLPELKQKVVSEEEIAIGKFVSQLIDDGSCLQVGLLRY